MAAKIRLVLAAVALMMAGTVVGGTPGAWAAAPPNDNFADAMPLVGPAGTVSGSTVEATVEAGEPCDYGCSPSVWFVWTSPSSDPSTVTFSLCGSSFDTALNIYTGATFAAMTTAAQNDDYCGSSSQGTFLTRPGVVYYIRIGGRDVSSGSFTLTYPAGGTVVDDDLDGYSTLSDCDDADPEVHPGTAEVYGNNKDDNCNGAQDEGFAAYYVDADQDQFGDQNGTPTYARTAPTGTTDNHTDCDDDDAAVNPLATELYNGRDDDCDGTQDEGFSAYYADGDGDLYGAGTATYATSQSIGFVTDSTDCDDNDAGVHPGATDIAGDGIDQDCSGMDTAAYESTVTYTGATQGKPVKRSKPVTFSATVTSTDSACVSSRSVTFTVNGVPKTVSSTTSGVAAAVYDVASWPSGAYPVTIALPASSSGACAADADGATGTWNNAPKKGRK